MDKHKRMLAFEAGEANAEILTCLIIKEEIKMVSNKRKIIVILSVIIIIGILFWKPIAGFLMRKTDPLVKFQHAWVTNDSLYLKHYIQNLSQEEFPKLAWSTTILSEETNVCFGNFDRSKKWELVPPEKKEIIKYNLVKFWQAYSASDLFFNKNRVVNLQRFYNDSLKFTDMEIARIIKAEEKL